jgi:putative oxidoreductase
MLDLALLIPRVIVGLLFMGHGLQKLFGWFGGHGLAGTASFFDQLGIRPATFWAVVAGLAETLGGLALLLGFATPVAAALLTAVMLTAIAFVHAPRGVWSAQGGFEYPLVLIATNLLYGLAGPGQDALDARLHLVWPMPELYLIGAVIALIVAIVLRLVASARLGGQPVSAPGTP